VPGIKAMIRKEKTALTFSIIERIFSQNTAFSLTFRCLLLLSHQFKDLKNISAKVQTMAG
jgi:hypothetical protein